MLVSPEELLFVTHLNREKFNIQGKNLENDKYFTDNAKYMHSILVKQGILKTRGEVASLSKGLANDHISFGLGRRLGIIWAAYGSIINIIHPSRMEPLSLEQGSDVMRDINAIYINIVGSIDNIAWHFREKYVRKDYTLKDMDVGLFKKKLLKAPGAEFVNDLVKPYEQWFVDLKRFRDPAAHRIPLAMPPQSLTDEDVISYEKYEGLYWGLISEERFEEADKIRDRQLRLGILSQLFISGADDEKYPLYPTVPEDVGTPLRLIGDCMPKF